MLYFLKFLLDSSQNALLSFARSLFQGSRLQALKTFLFFLGLSPSLLYSVDYSKKPEVKHFIQKMHTKYNYSPKYLETLFKHVRKNPKVTSKNAKPRIVKPLSEEYRPQGQWDIYSRVHLENNQTHLGVEFMHKYQKVFEKAYKTYGVPPEYVAAIIGIESHYGKNTGRYYVFDTLTQLAFGKHRRKRFYKYQLQEFLRLCYREQIEPRKVKGSKSGAMGMAQFLPSNYKPLAVDFNNDGKIRISKPADAIGSVANYLKESGWKKNEPVGTRVSYVGNRFRTFKTGIRYKYHRKHLAKIYPKKPFEYDKKVMLIKLEREKYDELWYGTHNFYVITRYNRCDYYAMAVHQLAERIKSRYLAKEKSKKDQKPYLAHSSTTSP